MPLTKERKHEIVGKFQQHGNDTEKVVQGLVDDVIDDPDRGAKIRDFAPYAPAGDFEPRRGNINWKTGITAGWSASGSNAV